MKCTRKTHSQLFGYLDAYGLDQRIINSIDRIKQNYVSGYAVVGFKEDDGSIGLMDLSNTPDRTKLASTDMSSFGWNMINDGMHSITEKEWNKLKLDDDCETFTIEGHPEYSY